MNGSAKRMMAMIAVLAMIASAMVVVFTDEQDSSADVDYNKYYYEHRILDGEPPQAAARVALTDAARRVVKTGLYLIGHNVKLNLISHPQPSL